MCGSSPARPLLCVADRLGPLDVRCEREALEEKALVSPRSPEEPQSVRGDFRFARLTL